MANTYTLLKKFSGTGTSITLYAIPTGYSHLIIKGSGKDISTTLPSVPFTMQYNSDTGSNYSHRLFYMDNVTMTGTAASSQTAMRVGYICTAKTSGASVTAPIEITIPDYQGVGGKLFYATSSAESPDTTNVYTLCHSSGRWTTTDAITSITLTTSGSGWDPTSRFCLYGIKLTA